jgi:prepilin-type N-terminal cleavage/methylation domain-containing protein
MRRAAAVGELNGHTLVELVVALVILAVGLLGLSATIGAISRMTTASLLAAQARFATQARIEELLAVPSDRIDSGEWRQGELMLSWQVSGGEPRQVVLVVHHALGPKEMQDTLTTLTRSP